jgi:hypothetical protein
LVESTTTSVGKREILFEVTVLAGFIAVVAIVMFRSMMHAREVALAAHHLAR